MKRLGLLIVSVVFLSGCTATNGIVSSKDLKEINHESIKPIIEKQKNIAYIPEDVKMFLSKLKDAKEITTDSEEGSYYLDIRVDERNIIEDETFLYETTIAGYVSQKEKDHFQKLIDVLDETISPGIKLYLGENRDIDTDETGTSKKIGRVWVKISKDREYEHLGTDESESEHMDSNREKLKNNISLLIKVRDIKDKRYKSLVDSISTEDLILRDIKVGNEQSVIKLSNLGFRSYDNYTLKKTAINYHLFVKDEDINKVRMVIVSPTDIGINDNDLISLKSLATELDFNTEDMKNLEEIKMTIKDNKKAKSSTSSERFNFNYSSLENTNYEGQNTKMAELIIEKRK